MESIFCHMIFLYYGCRYCTGILASDKIRKIILTYQGICRKVFLWRTTKEL